MTTASGASPAPADVQRLCRLGGLSRAGYYRRFEARAPRQADAELTSRIQIISLSHRFYGYRRITAVLRRSGLVVNAKRVQRLMREDTLLSLRRKPFSPPTSDSRHGFLIVPNLLRGLRPSGLDQIWVADITPAFAGAGSTSASGKPSAISPSSSMPSRARSWAGRWKAISTPPSPSRPSTPAFAGAG